MTTYLSLVPRLIMRLAIPQFRNFVFQEGETHMRKRNFLSILFLVTVVLVLNAVCASSSYCDRKFHCIERCQFIGNGLLRRLRDNQLERSVAELPSINTFPRGRIVVHCQSTAR
jgi:hypothetical protein